MKRCSQIVESANTAASAINPKPNCMTNTMPPTRTNKNTLRTSPLVVNRFSPSRIAGYTLNGSVTARQSSDTAVRPMASARSSGGTFAETYSTTAKTAAPIAMTASPAMLKTSRQAETTRSSNPASPAARHLGT